MLLPFLLTAALRGDPKPFTVPLPPSMALTFFPQEESSELKTKLGGRHRGKPITAWYRFPVVLGQPSRILRARIGNSGDWLVLGTEDTMKDALSFCVFVDSKKGSAKLLFADHSGVLERSDLLKRGIVREENLAKWIFWPLPPGSDGHDLWTRRGIFNPKTKTMAFGKWSSLQRPGVAIGGAGFVGTTFPTRREARPYPTRAGE